VRSLSGNIRIATSTIAELHWTLDASFLTSRLKYELNLSVHPYVAERPVRGWRRLVRDCTALPVISRLISGWNDIMIEMPYTRASFQIRCRVPLVRCIALNWSQYFNEIRFFRTGKAAPTWFVWRLHNIIQTYTGLTRKLLNFPHHISHCLKEWRRWIKCMRYLRSLQSHNPEVLLIDGENLTVTLLICIKESSGSNPSVSWQIFPDFVQSSQTNFDSWHHGRIFTQERINT
jgi:hypothetical protein